MRNNEMNEEYDFTPYYLMNQIVKFGDGFIAYDSEKQCACFYRVRKEGKSNRHEDWARAFLHVPNAENSEDMLAIDELLKRGMILYSKEIVPNDYLGGVLFPGQGGFSGDISQLEPDQIRMFLDLCRYEKRFVPKELEKELKRIRNQKLEENQEKYYGY